MREAGDGMVVLPHLIEYLSLRQKGALESSRDTYEFVGQFPRPPLSLGLAAICPIDSGFAEQGAFVSHLEAVEVDALGAVAADKGSYVHTLGNRILVYAAFMSQVIELRASRAKMSFPRNDN